jgi:Flp pilus assembly protein TadG
MPILTVLLMGIFDYGSLAYDSMQVSAAAHAGADYALHNGWSATGVQTAVKTATTLSVNTTPATQSTSNACIVAGQVVPATGTTCAGGGTPGTYVVVVAQAQFTPLASWAAFALPSTISAQATVRIQ